jgi:hypothetical protein
MLRPRIGAALGLLTFATCQPAPDAKAPAVAASGQSIAATPDTAAAAAFVRAFYASYTPRGVASGLAATDSLLRERPALFTPELLAALRQDAAARAAAKGEIDGLDADPFLAA